MVVEIYRERKREQVRDKKFTRKKSTISVVDCFLVIFLSQFILIENVSKYFVITLTNFISN